MINIKLFEKDILQTSNALDITSNISIPYTEKQNNNNKTFIYCLF